MMLSETVLWTGSIVVLCVVVTTLGGVVIGIMAMEAHAEWKRDGYPWFGKGWLAKLRVLLARRPVYNVPQEPRRASA